VAVKRGAFEEDAYEPNSSSAAGEEQLRAGEAVVGADVQDEEADPASAAVEEQLRVGEGVIGAAGVILK
jgi:hypothetical protein